MLVITLMYPLGHIPPVVQIVQYVVTFLFLPVATNPATIRDILKCNAENMALIFGAFVVSNSYGYLTTPTSTMMTMAYVFLVCRAIWRRIFS